MSPFGNPNVKMTNKLLQLGNDNDTIDLTTPERRKTDEAAAEPELPSS